MDKLKMHSPNFAEENIAKIAALFSNCVTVSTNEDGSLKKSIDFDLLTGVYKMLKYKGSWLR